tara:strand:+ start:4354 stop:5616 length:1263 start_codon:yes stop_codon:yes gene_type:complete
MSIKEKQNFQTSQDFEKSSSFRPSSEKDISEFIKLCNKKNIPIEIKGLSSKQKIGRNFQSEKELDLSQFSGIIKYEPEELYIKVKSGTSMEIITKELDKNNQQLAFEPINFGYIFEGKSNPGTIGGVVACNFSGSRRFKSGSVRDHVLGIRVVTGRGEIIKSGGTVVKNVTGYDLSKILTGSFGTLAVISEISVKVLPKPPSTKSLIIHNAHLKKSLEYLNISLSSTSDVSGAVFYPEYFKNQFTLNDLVNKGPITAIRVEGVSSSIDDRLQNLVKELGLLSDEINFLEGEQSKIFWDYTQNLRVFSKTDKNLIKAVVPPSETLNVINNLKKFLSRYFIDWGGNLIWMEVNKLNFSILKEINAVVNDLSGYATVIKLEDSLKANLDIFKIDPIKLKISEKIKKSFDPKRILNPGKMYSGI